MRGHTDDIHPGRWFRTPLCYGNRLCKKNVVDNGGSKEIQSLVSLKRPCKHALYQAPFRYDIPTQCWQRKACKTRTIFFSGLEQTKTHSNPPTHLFFVFSNACWRWDSLPAKKRWKGVCSSVTDLLRPCTKQVAPQLPIELLDIQIWTFLMTGLGHTTIEPVLVKPWSFSQSISKLSRISILDNGWYGPTNWQHN